MSDRTVDRDSTPYLSVRGVARTYGGVQALRRADLTVSGGEIHGLVGENGAGKSTLVRIMAGIEAPDAGSVQRGTRTDGTPVRLAIVPQYPRMAQELSVWQNLLVGDEPRRGPFLAAHVGRRRIEEIADRFDIALDLTKPAGDLGGTEIRLAALLAALVHRPDVLILDEPTVGLAATDQTAILNTLRRFRDARHAVVYISHDLTEVCTISDRVTPLRNGTTEGTLNAPVSPHDLASRLFGQADDRPSPPGDPLPGGDAIVTFDGAVIRNHRSARQLGPLDLEIAAGCITAITGVRESGLDLIEQYLAGEAVLDAGAIRLDGRRLNARVDPARLRRRDMAFVPSDRFDRAAALSGSVEENAILQERAAVHPGGFRTTRRARGITHRLLETFGLTVSRLQPLSALSGGTIQKLILARELDRRPRVCVIAEPTAGLDLRSQSALAGLLHDLAAAGSAVVVLSSSMQAAQRMAHRVHVLHGGRLAGTFAPDQDEAIARAFAGIGGSDTSAATQPQGEGCP